MSINPLAASAKAWPFVEAQALAERMKKLPAKAEVVFETGYGPSGLPHIGTFGEVARTTMVRRAYELLTGQKTRLICFSDDMDGLRKVPDNLPQQDMIAANLGKPLTSIPDPFGTHESFGHHMNARLRAFLDTFGFEYEFMSSTETYKNGVFDKALLNVLAHYEKVMQVMLPTLGEERQQTYSPFLPVSPRSGKVLLAKVTSYDVAKGTITYVEEDGSEETVPVTGGHCKLQWKPDFGMRWAALGVDYEMYGKDHLASEPLYDAICQIAGGTPPQHMMFELFLDEKGQKISKSKGNGLTIDEWLTYGPTESLALYMYQSPRKAKKLYFDVIPQQVDDYLTFVEKYAAETDEAKRLENPAWHVHGGHPPAPEAGIKFSMLLNLASACNPENASVLWGFLKRELPDATPENSPMLDKLCQFAVRYYYDFVKPTKQFRAATDTERTALTELREYLASLTDTPPLAGGRMGGGLPAHLSSDEASQPPPQPSPCGGGSGPTADDIQTRIYDLGLKYYSKETMRDWFKAMYEVLLGSQQGPRMGSFIHLFGPKETIALIDESLARAGVAAA